MASEHPEVSLDGLKAGESGLVHSVSSKNRALCSKLLSMGIVAGTVIEVLGRAPLGDPIQIKARGYKLSLRINEASQVSVIQA